MKYIFFDFDGTIADTEKVILSCFHHALISLGYKDRTNEEIATTIGLPLKEEFIQLANCDSAQADLLVQEFRKKYFVLAFQELKTYPGMVELIHYLSEKGYGLGILSSKLHHLIDKMMKTLALDSFFSIYVGEDDIERKKPYPDMALLAMEKLGASKEECIMIGDSQFDIEMAKNANIKVIYCTYGYGNREKCLSLQPEFVVNSAKEIENIL